MQQRNSLHWAKKQQKNPLYIFFLLVTLRPPKRGKLEKSTFQIWARNFCGKPLSFDKKLKVFFFFVLPLAVTAWKSGDDKALPHSSCISWSSVSKLQQSSSGLSCTGSRTTNGTAQILGASHLECNCKTLVGLERFFKIFACWHLGSFSCTELFFCTFSVF